MADIKTTVHSPFGAIEVVEGRIPLHKAKRDTAAMLRRRIEEDTQHLSEIDNWFTKASRGSLKVLNYEEQEKRNDSH